MSEPTANPQSEPPTAADLQPNVQRQLGRCLLRLQQYERLLKAILADQEISGTIDTAMARQAERFQDLQTATLGTLVNDFLGGYVNGEGQEAPEPRNLERQVLASGKAAFRVTMTMEMSDERLSETKAGLRELVALRNELVHHFIEKFDLGTVDGCVAATAHLATCYLQIEVRFEELHRWGASARNARAMAASLMQSDVFGDFVENGIEPDGTISWPFAGIVGTLREAWQALELDGWAPLNKAIEWAGQHHPEQTPAKYRCVSWPHVLHESRIFKLEYRLGKDDSKVAWYCERSSRR